MSATGRPYRVCVACGQGETWVQPIDGREGYYLHLGNENPHCEAPEAVPVDSCPALAPPVGKEAST